jgi:hypothetical protein
MMALGGATGLGWWIWHLVGGHHRFPWTVVGLIVGVVAAGWVLAALRLLVPVLVLGAVGGVGVLGWMAFTRWSAGVLAMGLVGVGVVLAYGSAGPVRGYRSRRSGWWSVGAATAFVAAVVWMVATSWSLGWIVAPAGIVLSFVIIYVCEVHTPRRWSWISDLD